jgi:hypothetical protein
MHRVVGLVVPELGEREGDAADAVAAQELGGEGDKTPAEVVVAKLGCRGSVEVQGVCRRSRRVFRAF